jgi:hypothetical protein
MQFGIDEMWPHLFCVGGQQKVMALSCLQLHVWIDCICDNKHVVYVIPCSSSLALGTKISEKHKSASLSVMQVKNRWKTIGIEEKLDIISQLEDGKLLTYAVVLVSLILAYVQSVIMLIEC